MRRMKRYGKIIVFDTLAVFCFIGVILFGWLPGPGGIPLFLLGLSLLAVNHDWAERWLNTAKHKGVSFRKWLFPNKAWVKNTYDVAAVALICAAGAVLVTSQNRFIEGAAVVIITSSLFVFLINRDRFGSFTNLLRKIKRKYRKHFIESN